MAGTFRVVDTGVREGRFNIAFDQAMLEPSTRRDAFRTRSASCASRPRR